MFQTNAAAPAPTIIFLHVPKSAGSTLSKIVDQIEGHAAYRTDPGRCGHRSRNSNASEAAALSAGDRASGIWSAPPPSTMTMLRPIDRIVNLYYFILRIPQHHHHQQVVGSK